jgi:hypothetical protein
MITTSVARCLFRRVGACPIRLFIIESPAPGDLLAGTAEGLALAAAAELIGHEVASNGPVVGLGFWKSSFCDLLGTTPPRHGRTVLPRKIRSQGRQGDQETVPLKARRIEPWMSF